MAKLIGVIVILVTFSICHANAQTPIVAWTTAIQTPPSVTSSVDTLLQGGSGSTLVAGVDVLPAAPSPFIASLDSNGGVTWKTSLGYPGYRVFSFSADTVGVIAALNNGDLSTILKRVDNAGALQWDRSIFPDTGSTIAVDPDGNHIVVSGSRSAPVVFSIRKISPDGQDLWATSITTPTKSRFDFPESRFIAPDGGIAITGITPNRDFVCNTGVCAIQHEMQTVRLDKNGNVLWNSLIGRGAGLNYAGSAVTIRADGVTIAAGTSRENGALRVFAFGLDANGQEIWRWRTPVIDSPVDPFVRIVADPQNNILLAYQFSRSAPESSRLIKLTANGEVDFEASLPGLLAFGDLHLDASGSAYVMTSISVEMQGVLHRVFRVAADGSQVWQLSTGFKNGAIFSSGGGPPFSVGGGSLNAMNESQATVQRIDQTGQLPLTLGRVVSRRSHAVAGSFDVELDRFAPASAPTIDSRKSANGDSIVFKFNQVVGVPGNAVGNYALGASTSLVARASGNEVNVEIPALLEGEKFSVTLNNPGGGATVSTSIAQLMCEVSGNRSIGQEDIQVIKAQSGRSPRDGAARFDINRSGAITAAEIAACKSRVGRTM